MSAFYELTDLPPGIADPAVLPRQARVRDIVAAGGYDQTEDPRFFGCSPPYLPLGSRRDVLVFQTEPLAEDVEVTGPIEVVLWVSSSAVDTDFTAKLIDSYPPNMHYPYGFNLNLTDSIIRLRYRHGDGKADPLPPGESSVHKDHLAAHQQPLCRRPSDTARHLEFQLPSLRREPEYRRAAPTTPSQGPGGQHGVSRRCAPVARRAADHPAMTVVACGFEDDPTGAMAGLRRVFC